MPAINKIRFANIKYAENTNNKSCTYLKDLTFSIKKGNALIELINGGGKTVLLTYLTQVFLWNYDVYPKGSKTPSFNFASLVNDTSTRYVLIEFILEDGRYMLVGVCIRKNDKKDESNEDILKKSFVYIYKNKNDEFSLENIKLFEDNGAPKSYHDFDKYLQTINGMNRYSKRNSNNIGNHKDFYNYLMQNRLDIKEFENINIKILSSEGGLTNVFDNSTIPNTTNLLKEHILPTIKQKITDDSFSEDSFEISLLDLIKQSKEKQNEIKDVKIYKEFIPQLETILNYLKEEKYLYKDKQEIESNKLNIIKTVSDRIDKNEEIIKEKELEISNIYKNISEEKYKKDSLEIKDKINNLKCIENEISTLKDKNKNLLNIFHDKNLKKILLEANKLNKEKNAVDLKLQNIRLKMNSTETDKNKEYLNNIKYSLSYIYKKELNSIKTDIQNISDSLSNNENDILSMSNLLKKSNIDLNKQQKSLNIINSEINIFEKNCQYLKNEYTDIDSNFLEKNTSLKLNDNIFTELLKIKIQIESNITNKNEMFVKNKNKLDKINEDIKDIEKQIPLLKFNITQNENFIEEYNKDLSILQKDILSLDCDYNIDEDKSNLINFLDTEELKYLNLQKDSSYKIKNIYNKLENLKNNKFMIDPLVEENLKQIISNDILYGCEFIQQMDCDNNTKLSLYKKIPIILYSIILTKGEYEKLLKVGMIDRFCGIVPILIREDLDKIVFSLNKGIIEYNNISFYGGYNESFIDNNFIENEVKILTNSLEEEIDLENKIELRYQKILSVKSQILSFYDKYKLIETIKERIISEKKEEADIKNKIAQLNIEKNDVENIVKDMKVELKNLNKNLSDYLMELKEINKLYEIKDNYYNNLDKKDLILSKIKEIEEYNNELNKSLNDKNDENELLKNQLNLLNTDLKVFNAKYGNYNYDEIIGTLLFDNDKKTFEMETLVEMLNSFLLKTDLEENEQTLKILEEDYNKKSLKLQIYIENNKIVKEDFINLNYSDEIFENINNDIINIKTEIEKNKINLNQKTKELNDLERTINHLKENCKTNYNKDFLEIVEKDNFDDNILILEKNLKITKKENNSLKQNLDKLKVFYKFYSKHIENLKIYEFAKLELVPENTEEIENLYSLYENKLNEIIEKIKKININKNKIIKQEEKHLPKEYNTLLNILDSLSLELNISNLDNFIKSLEEQIIYFKGYIENIENDLEFYNKSLNILNSNIILYIKGIFEQFKTFDKYSKYKGQKRFILNGIPDIGNETNIINYLNEIIENGCLKDEKNLNAFVKDKLSLYNLLFCYMNYPHIIAKLAKFNSIDGYSMINYEKTSETGKGGQLSGGQHMVSVAILLSTLVKYSKIDNKSYTTLLMDNPFGKMSTSEYLEEFYEIMKNANINIISFTALYLADIAKKQDAYYKILLKNKKNGGILLVSEELDVTLLDNVGIHSI